MPSRSPARSVSRGRSRTRSYTPSQSRSPAPRRSITPRSKSRSRSARRSVTPRDDRAGRPDTARAPRDISKSRSRSYSRSRSGERNAAAARGGGAPPKNAKIVVEKLTKNVTENHLREIFGVYGVVQSVDMPMNKTCELFFLQCASFLKQVLTSPQSTQIAAQHTSSTPTPPTQKPRSHTCMKANSTVRSSMSPSSSLAANSPAHHHHLAD